MKNVMKMLAAFMIGVVLLCFVLAAGFTFVDDNINPFRVTAIANPLIASTTLATMGWIARKMVIRHWLESENDETYVIIIINYYQFCIFNCIFLHNCVKTEKEN